jgi:hypothetical protein
MIALMSMGPAALTQVPVLPPGEQLLSQMRLEGAQEIRMVADIVEEFASVMPTDAQKILRDHGKEAAQLLLAMRKEPAEVAVRQLSLQQPDKTALYIQVAVRLFPLDSYRIYGELLRDPALDVEALGEAAATLNIDTHLFDLAQQRVVVTPLFNSASVLLFGRSAEETIRVEYRPRGQRRWLLANQLLWDPIAGALSGSVVRLSAGTDHELRITVLEESRVVEVIDATFRTWDEQPPVDPEKVYRLADIYQGGTLDLVALGIRGKAGGWARIIGDPETPIIAGADAKEAIRIGNHSYILFENITVRGGRNAISADSAHHLRFSGCDISGWGRAPAQMRDGLAYESEEATEPINLDAAFALVRSGVVVVEQCHVHSPRPRANHWSDGHPRGPTAFLADANHPDPAFRGQVVLRHNRFHGSPEHRFNDVIESRLNGRVWGGFVRDSAIHDNYLAYANDDIVEIDGGQSNILLYNNHMEQGYCGISAAPNMRGPSYIFNNFIHNLGDERQLSWAAVKVGGLYSAPGGVLNVFENVIATNSNGIAYAGFRGDSAFWVNMRNNVLLSTGAGARAGFMVYDIAGYPGSNFVNNHFYRLDEAESKLVGPVDPALQQFAPAIPSLLDTLSRGQMEMKARVPEQISNFSVRGRAGHVRVGIVEAAPDP